MGQRSTVDRAAVFDSVDGILLAWFVVRDLGLIPRNFPEPLPLSVNQVAAPPSSSSSPPDWDWLWRPGKTHAIPGALSRAPVDDPTPADQVAERDVELHVRRVVTAVSANLAESLPPLTPATDCKGTSPVDPLLTSQQKEPFAADPLPRRVFEVASADFFSHAGQTYLVYSDRLSGWMEIAQLPSTAARPTIRTLAAWFCRLGIPTMLRTDGGPPFNSHDFRMFLDRWSVTHAPSSPHYPQSNDHAEANVKKVKFLLRKSAPDGDIASTAFQQGHLELRNTPDASGRSPAQIVLVSLCDRSSLPTIAASPPNGPLLVIVSTSVPPTIATPPSEHTTAVANPWVLCSLAQPSAFRTRKPSCGTRLPRLSRSVSTAQIASASQVAGFSGATAAFFVSSRQLLLHHLQRTSLHLTHQTKPPRRSTRTRNAPTRLTM